MRVDAYLDDSTLKHEQKEVMFALRKITLKLMFVCLFVCLILIEKLGFFSSSPGYSCKHIQDSGDSIGDGEYWIDPEKNGNPLKVFCDMTTDGGISFKIMQTFKVV